MAESPDGQPDRAEPDNVRRVHQLVRMMRKYDLSAVDLVEGSTRIRLRRGGAASVVAPMPAAPPPAPSATPAPAPSSPTPPADEPPSGIAIESPMVGTFYQSGSPDAPPFVTPGSVVRPETTVCIIEAMKVFTEIPAGISGKVVEILVQDKQSVEFGQPLFQVEPS